MRTAIVLGCLLLALNGCYKKKDNGGPNLIRGRGGTSIILLFHAKGADFEFAHPSTGELTLRYVSPVVVYLTDDLQQRSKSLPMDEIIADWQKGQFTFSKAVPNAGFFAFEDTQRELADLSFTLSHPHYNASTHTLLFEIDNWHGQQVKHLDHVTLYVSGTWKQPIHQEIKTP